MPLPLALPSAVTAAAATTASATAAAVLLCILHMRSSVHWSGYMCTGRSGRRSPTVGKTGQGAVGRWVGLVGGVTQTVLEGDAPVCPSFDEVGADHLPTEILS